MDEEETLFEHVYTPPLWAVGGYYYRWATTSVTTEHPRYPSHTNTHTQDHTLKQRDNSKYPTSDTLCTVCHQSVMFTAVHKSFFLWYFLVLPSFSATSYSYTSAGKTLATTSTSHLTWQSGCIMGNVDKEENEWNRKREYCWFNSINLGFLKCPSWVWQYYRSAVFHKLVCMSSSTTQSTSSSCFAVLSIKASVSHTLIYLWPCSTISTYWFSFFLYQM